MNKAYLKEFINSELKIDANDDILAKFERYESLLKEYNAKFNLTAIRDDEGVLEKHFIDSICSMKYVSFENKSLCDIGTGAGFPGMVLALLNPSLKVTLVESNGKKVSFLKIVKEELKLDNVEVLCARAEEMYGYKEKFDFVTARAVTQLNVLLELSIPLLKVGGELIAYKLADNDEEIKGATNALKVLNAKIVDNYKFNLPISNAPRSLIVIKKEKITESKYPRPFNQISKKGL